eukprot:14347-Amphidinium_carterae.1
MLVSSSFWGGSGSVTILNSDARAKVIPKQSFKTVVIRGINAEAYLVIEIMETLSPDLAC